MQDLQSSLDSHIELVTLLSATSEENIVQVLRDLKAAPEPLAYLATARSDLDTQQQERRASTDTSVTGSLHSLPRVDLEFDELTARYQIAYPALPPIQLATVDRRPRFPAPTFEPNAGQQLLFDMGAARLGNPAALVQTQLGSTDPLSSLTATLAWRLRPPRQADSSPWPEPVTQPSYIDERLRRLQIDYWTSVPVSNGFAATVISAYLEVDHPCYAFFDVDLFLHDLVNLGINFCSPFLVSSMLSQACVSLESNISTEDGVDNDINEYSIPALPSTRGHLPWVRRSSRKQRCSTGRSACRTYCPTPRHSQYSAWFAHYNAGRNWLSKHNN